MFYFRKEYISNKIYKNLCFIHKKNSEHKNKNKHMVNNPIKNLLEKICN
jgi:hypothetical protein